MNAIKTIIFTLATILPVATIIAQQSVNTAGGNGTSVNGSVSYSIGQIDYKSATSTGGSMSQGVQQTYEITSTGLDTYSNITLQALLYPNPTRENINLKITNFPLKNVSFQLTNIEGNVILKQIISEENTPIVMNLLADGIYFVTILENEKNLKTFKIIKNN
jgi:hypothetical protein